MYAPYAWKMEERECLLTELGEYTESVRMEDKFMVTGDRKVKAGNVLNEGLTRGVPGRDECGGYLTDVCSKRYGGGG